MTWISKLFLLLFLTKSLLGSDFGCISEYKIISEDGKYYIHAFDDLLEDDLSLEAKAYLYYFIKKRDKIKGDFSIEMSYFKPVKEYRCKDQYHEVFEVQKSDMKIVPPNNIESFRDIKMKIFQKIAEIETKDKLTVQDLKRLMSLYLSLGKVNKSSKIIDEIMDLEMKEM